MKITLEWLEELEACEDGVEYYKTLGVEDFFEVLKCCVRDDKNEYVYWLLDNGDIRTLDKSDVLAFCEKYGDVNSKLCAELVLKFSQGVSYKEYYVGLINELGVEGVKDLTLADVIRKGRDYWEILYRATPSMSVEESVYYICLRIIDATFEGIVSFCLNRLGEKLGDERFSYRGQLDFLLKELKV